MPTTSGTTRAKPFQSRIRSKYFRRGGEYVYELAHRFGVFAVDCPVRIYTSGADRAKIFGGIGHVIRGVVARCGHRYHAAIVGMVDSQVSPR